MDLETYSEISKSKLVTLCNNNEDHSIYTIGFTGDVEGDNHFTESPINKVQEKIEPGKTYTSSAIIANPGIVKEDSCYTIYVEP